MLTFNMYKWGIREWDDKIRNAKKQRQATAKCDKWEKAQEIYERQISFSIRVN